MSRRLSKDPRGQVLGQMTLRTLTALDALNQSRPQKKYDQTCRQETALLKEIAKSGDLALMLDVESDYQKSDRLLARTPNDKTNVEQGLKDFERGMSHYNTLIGNPDRYRENDFGYVDRERDKKLNVPVDGMRKALDSQKSRLKNRMALTSSDDERDLLAARAVLIGAIKAEYLRLQVEVLRKNEGE